MIEVVSVFARWVQLAANLILLGSSIFLALASQSTDAYPRPWVNRVERMFPWLAISALLGLLLTLIATAGQLTGDIAGAIKPDILFNIVQSTQAGKIWLISTILTIILIAVVFYLKFSSRARWHYFICAIFAALPLISGSLSSHSATEEFSVSSILPYALHILLAGIWFGALPAFLILLQYYVKNENSSKANNIDIQILKRFSFLALPVMLSIIATGLYVAYHLFEERYAALVVTPYGWLLNIKLLLLVIILAIASRVRSSWLPDFAQNLHNVVNSARKMVKWIRIEYLFALGIVLLATILSNTTPAKNALIDNWPFPFRFSFEATWGVTSTMIQFWVGVALFILACALFYMGKIRRWNLKKIILFPVTLLIASFAEALPPIAIEAYPETYQKSPIPFDTASIGNGATLYSENCVTCHGPQGKGNGVQSRTMTTLLPDMLVEPHVNAHTAGDLYHWISFGMKDTDMPGYAEKFDEDERWDLINFFHALYRGYQARLLTPDIVSNKPVIVPPSFYYESHDGASGILEDFRAQKMVLLVVFSWPESSSRLNQLSEAMHSLENHNAVILAVPTGELDSIEQIAGEFPFPILSQGVAEIITSYALYRRTLGHPDIIGAGKTPAHMEFLIDKSGYLRARWIPSLDESGWAEIDLLVKQINFLNQEKPLAPFPEDYVF